MSRIIGAYKNGNYVVTIFNDGTKIRSTNADEFIPAFAENCDVKISDYCNIGCKFCYEGCSVNGKHAVLLNDDRTPSYNFLNTLHPYTEMALNGNDVMMPKFEEFLKFLKNKFVIANVTFNQKHFKANKDYIMQLKSNKLINGIGISLTDVDDTELMEFLNTQQDVVIHTIAGIIDDITIEKLKKYPNLKILILGYKTLKRGINYKREHNSDIAENFRMLQYRLKEMTETFKVISFDNLAIEQLDVKNTLFKNNQEEWDKFYMGDDGTFTFYIDMVKGEYAKNSCMSEDERFPIGDLTIDEMFMNIKNKYQH